MVQRSVGNAFQSLAATWLKAPIVDRWAGGVDRRDAEEECCLQGWGELRGEMGMDVTLYSICTRCNPGCCLSVFLHCSAM